MTQSKKSKMNRAGFTLIEVLVSLAIAVMGIIAITQLFRLYLQIVSEEKVRVTAAVLGNEKLETIRNLSYDVIGTIGGIPSGNLIQDEVITKNGINFNVKTEVIYIDDPFDGLITTTGFDNSIYQSDSDEVLYYWSMSENTPGTTPEVGSGSLAFTGTSITEGYQGDGLLMENGDKVSTSATGNINLNSGRIGVWYKPETGNAVDGGEYFVKIETAGNNFSFYRRTNERVRLQFGGRSVTSSILTWNPDQWYFMEAAWDSNNYRQVWRDGVPVAISLGSGDLPEIETDMYIGYDGGSSGEVNGMIDELYILDNAHRYEIWGYNQFNPYVESYPQLSYYWNMDSGDISQTPQVGVGNITVGGNFETVSPAVKNDGLRFNGNGHTDYAVFPTDQNIDFSYGRVAFWYRPRNVNVYAYNTPHLMSSPCTDGYFGITRNASQQLLFQYGSNTDNETLASQAIPWRTNWWYLIEAAFDDVNDTITLYMNGQELASSNTTTLGTPTGCTNMYVGNETYGSILNGEGRFDELFILSDAFPDSGDQDLLNTDYKRVKITVSWEGPFGGKEIYTITDIAPPGIETTAGGGTLIIHVFDSQGLPVQEADISIINNSLDPAIDLDLTTDTSGTLILPGAPATSTSYEIVVTKSGFSNDFTMAATSTYINPVRDHLSVIENETTEISFSIDNVSTLNVTTVSQSLPVNWQINTDDTDTNQMNGSIANNNSHIYLTWEDLRTSSTSLTYAQKYSTIGIKQWTNDVLVDQTQNQYAPKTVIDSTNNQYITWYDDSSGDNDIYIMKLNSSGANSWVSPYKVNSDSGSDEQTNPGIAYANDEAYVVWQDERNDGGDIYFNKFSPAGSKIYVGDIKINTDSGSSVQKDPIILAAQDGTLYVSWIDNRSGQDDIYLHRINSDGTNNWTNEIQVNNNLADTISDYDLSIDTNDDCYLSWSDNRNSNYDIYWQGVASSSSLLFVNDQIITTQSPNENQQSAKIVADGNDDLFIGWHDSRSGNLDVYILKIDNQGNELWPQEVRINLEEADNQILTDLSVYQTDRVIATWDDYSQGDADVWAGTLNYDGSETQVPFVDFQLKGSKLTHETPDLAKFEQIYVSDAQGEITISDLEWDTYTVIITDPSYSLVQSEPASPFSLLAGTSTELKLIVD